MSTVVGGVKIRIDADATNVESQTVSAMEKLKGTVTKQAKSVSKSLTESLSKPFKTFASNMPKSFGEVWSGMKSGAASAAKASASFITTNLSKSFDVVKSAASVAFVAIGGIITANMGKAIDRADILNNFPKVMENIGFSADDAAIAIDKIKDGLDGLPSTTQSIASVTQSLSPLTGSVQKAADVALSMNNALLAGGAAFGVQENAMEMYRNMMARGTVDMMSWRSIQTAMPGQLDQMAVALLGATAKSADLYDAMQDGTVSFDDFNNALVKLNADGIDGFASFEDQARAATGGVRTAVANMVNRVVAALEKIITWFGVDKISGALNEFSSQFGGWAQKLIDWLERVKSSADLSKLTSGLAPLIGIAAGIGASFMTWLPWVGPMFTKLTGPVGFFIGLMVQMWQNSKVLRDAIKNAFTVLGNMLSSSAPLIESVSALFDRLAEILGNMLGSAINTLIPIVEALFTVLGPILSGALTTLMGLLNVLGPVLEFLAPVIAVLTAAWFAFNIVLNANPIMLIVTAIGALVAALVWFFTETQVGQAIVEAVWGAIQAAIGFVVDWWEGTAYPIIRAVIDALGAAWEWLSEITGAVWEWITNKISAFVDWFGENVYPVIESVIEMIMAIWDALAEAAGVLWDGLKIIFEWIGEGWSLLVEGFAMVWEAVGQPLLDAIMVGWEVVSEFLTTTWEIISIAFEAVWTHISIVFTAIWDVMKAVVETVMGVIRGIIDTVTALIRGDWEAAWNAIKSIFSSIWDGIKNIASTAINAVKNIISNVVNAISSAWSAAWNGIKNVFSTIWEGIKSGARAGVDAVFNVVTGIKDRILGFFSGAATWLIDSGKALLNGFKDGIMSAFSAVGDAISSGLSWVRGLFPFSPAKRGPFSGFGYTTFAGQALMKDFGKGIERGALGAKEAAEESLMGIQNVFSDAYMGETLADSLADGLLDGQSEVVKAAEDIAKAAADILGDIDPLEISSGRPIKALVSATTSSESSGVRGATSGLTDDVSVELSRGDMDYLVDRLSETLEGMAQSAAIVTDLAMHGQNRHRRGSF